MKISEILLEDRTEFLRAKYLPIIGNRLEKLRIPDGVRASIQRAEGATDEERVFSWLAALDPTRNRQYLQWILGCAIDRNVPFEDMVHVRDALATYHERKQRNTLPPEARDINRIKTPSQLDVLLRDVQGGVVQAAADEEARARRESRVLLDDGNWLVLIPRTERAAQFYGRGTEWCTAWGDPRGLHPKRTCQFDEYNKDGPMVIAINKRDPKERYQFHGASNQYMDRRDERIGDDDILRLGRDPALARVLFPHIPVMGAFSNDKGRQLAAVRSDGDAIRYIRNPSPEMQLAAVQQSGYAIQFIQDPSPEMQLAAVQQSGHAIKYIKDPSPEMQLAAVRETGAAIEYIQDPSPEVQLAAVRERGSAIVYIRDPSPEVVELARRLGYVREGRHIG